MARYVVLPIIGTAVLSAVALAILQRNLPKLLYNRLFAERR